MQTPDDIAKKLRREIRKGERIMDTLEANPELSNDEMDHRLGQLVKRIKGFVAAR